MKPDWSSSPSWAAYAAQELSGTWYFHELQPRYQELTGEWVSKGQRQIIPKVSDRAQDTLEARPKLDEAYWQGIIDQEYGKRLRESGL